jgi:hypothetical protein
MWVVARQAATPIYGDRYTAAEGRPSHSETDSRRDGLSEVKSGDYQKIERNWHKIAHSGGYECLDSFY